MFWTCYMTQNTVSEMPLFTEKWWQILRISSFKCNPSLCRNIGYVELPTTLAFQMGPSLSRMYSAI